MVDKSSEELLLKNIVVLTIPKGLAVHAIKKAWGNVV